ncbi:cation:H+ antiporter [Evansella vedderi]|uniref:Cation:H+ antiporter n=1 Tax=Evansella vedderi TaxID=38282 RepID=A0ABT9ZVY5_9BACI|nr:sodium:calcium antiporter [Evansella vedderi]MDQ0255405.1 cation:H+ antiporter [Evansella vedderi]
MMYFLFIVAAMVTIYSAIKLSTYADVLSERTSMGGMLVGTLLLAGATSLPEVTTSATAVFVNNPDIAVGNVLGSNLFNLFILATVDLIYRKKRMMTQISKNHTITALIALGLTGLVLITILYPTNISFLGIGMESYLLIIFYGISMKFLSNPAEEMPIQVTEREISASSEKEGANNKIDMPSNAKEIMESYHTRAISVKKAKYGFVFFAIIIFVTGSLLTIAGNNIANATGISSSFIGSFLIAGATSLPEFVTVLVAIQLLNYNLAVGNILGSNIFNIMILAFTDFLFRGGSILGAASPVTAITTSAVIILNIIVIFGIILWQRKGNVPFGYPFPSILLIVFYGVSSYLIFTFS